MGWLDRALVGAQVISTLAGVYDQHAERKRKAANDEKDRRISELEARLARLEADAAARERPR